MLILVRKKINYWAPYTILRLLFYILPVGKNIILVMFQIIGDKKKKKRYKAILEIIVKMKNLKLLKHL